MTTKPSIDANSVIHGNSDRSDDAALTPLQKMTTSQLFDRDPEQWDDESIEEAKVRLGKILERFRKARAEDLVKKEKTPATKKKRKAKFNKDNPLETKL